MFATTRNDPHCARIPNFFRVLTGINPFISRFPLGLSVTAFRLNLPPNLLIVVNQYLALRNFGGGASNSFDIIVRPPRYNTKWQNSSQRPPAVSAVSTTKRCFPSLSIPAGAANVDGLISLYCPYGCTFDLSVVFASPTG